MKPLRVGIVGIGFGQQVHLPAFRADGRAEVVAICASTEDRARAVADRCGIPHATGDWRALVSRPDVDLVAISVPPRLQAEIALAAIAAGKHVFCEKPLGQHFAEAEAVAQAARAAGVVGAVDFEFPQIPAWQVAKQLCARRAVGRVRHVAVQWHIETFAYRKGGPSWKTDGAGGGGTLNLFVSHTVQCIEWLLAPITRLAARLSPSDAAAEARVYGWFQLDDGTPVAISVAADAFAGTGHRWEIYGDDGAIILENVGTDYVNDFSVRLATRAGGGVWARMDQPLAEPPADGRIYAVAGLVRGLLNAVDESGPREAVPTLEVGVRVQRVLDLMRQADREGRWLALD